MKFRAGCNLVIAEYVSRAVIGFMELLTIVIILCNSHLRTYGIN